MTVDDIKKEISKLKSHEQDDLRLFLNSIQAKEESNFDIAIWDEIISRKNAYQNGEIKVIPAQDALDSLRDKTL